MNTKLIALATGILTAHAGYAQETPPTEQTIPGVDARAFINQTPTYRDGVLGLPASVAFDDDGSGELALFRNIRLSLNEEGGFDVLSAEPQLAASLERLFVTTTPEAPHVTLVAVGELSSGCMRADTPVLVHEAAATTDDPARDRIRVAVGEREVFAAPSIGGTTGGPDTGGGGTGTGAGTGTDAGTGTGTGTGTDAGTGAGTGTGTGTDPGTMTAAAPVFGDGVPEPPDCLLGPAPFATATMVQLGDVVDGEYLFDAGDDADGPGFAWTEGAAGPLAGDDAEGALDDGEILRVLSVLNDGEIEQARVALDRAEGEEVRTLAQLIITDHEAANAEIDALGDAAGVPLDSELSDFIARHAMAAVDQLEALEDAAFNCAWLQVQAGQHEMALNLATGLLLPEAEDEAVRALLREVTPRLAEHLDEARRAVRANDCAAVLVMEDAGTDRGNLVTTAHVPAPAPGAVP